MVSADTEPLIQPYVYLFNIIVALEWQPGVRYMRQLRAAFRRASDFLYDATDGYMAFGQVLFGGPELMDCADIQIMASRSFAPTQLGQRPARAQEVSADTYGPGCLAQAQSRERLLG